MARTISQIYDALWVELQTQSQLNALNPQTDDQQTLLSDLNSPSRVSEHRLWLWLVAVFTWMQEVLFDRHKVEVQALNDENKPGHVKWWAKKLLEFQYGTALTFVDDIPSYAVVDENLQIVKYSAAISLGGGNVLLKGNGDSSGEPVALSAPQITAVQEYCRQLQVAGPSITFISLNADLLRLTTAEVIVDPLVLSTVDGSLLSDPSVKPASKAVRDFLKAIDYNGSFDITDLVAAVKAANGVIDFRLDLAESKVGVQPYATIDWHYQTVSGFMREDTSPGNSFDDTITYATE